VNPLESLLRPSSVAVVGASNRESPGRRVITSLRDGGFAGKVYPVNPKYETVADLPCYPSVSAIGAPVDAVVLAVGGRHVPDIVGEAVECGVTLAVILSSGFGETNHKGLRLERRLAALTGQIRILGPNCMGFVNVHHRVAAYSGPIDGIIPGGLAIVTQSGAVGCSLANAAQSNGIGLSYLISSGNCLDLSSSAYVDFLAGDPNTTVIALYLENLADGRDLLEASIRAREAGKALIALKPGSSEAGRRALTSHTAALSGSSEVTRAAFRQAGISLVSDLDELIQCLLVFCRLPGPLYGSIALVTISGAEAALLADLAADVDLPLAVFTPDTCSDLEAALPNYAPIANPLDTTGAGIVEGDNSAYRRALEIVARDPNVGLVVAAQDAYNGLHVETRKNVMLRDSAAALAAAAASNRAPFVALSPSAGPIDDASRSILGSQPIPVLVGARAGLTAIADFVSFYDSRPQVSNLPPMGTRSLSGIRGESEAKALLAGYGIPTLEGHLAASAGEAVAAARNLGFPVALKIEADGVYHKSDVGGVRLGLHHEAAVQTAYDDLMVRAASTVAPAAVKGVSVQPMAADGVELICGLKFDTQFGYVLLFGLGGTSAEILRDVSLRLAPVDLETAHSMIREIKGYPLLTAPRGAAPCDVPAIADILVSLSTLVFDFDGSIREIDINPLLAPYGAKPIVVDALIVSADKLTGSDARNDRLASAFASDRSP
jgi:acetate---CoA ligase (ADP-forming)